MQQQDEDLSDAELAELDVYLDLMEQGKMFKKYKQLYGYKFSKEIFEC